MAKAIQVTKAYIVTSIGNSAWQILFGHQPVALHFSFYNSPKLLNGIQLWRICWQVHHPIASTFNLSDHCMWFMDRAIIHYEVTPHKTFIKIHYVKKFIHKFYKMIRGCAFRDKLTALTSDTLYVVSCTLWQVPQWWSHQQLVLSLSLSRAFFSLKLLASSCFVASLSLGWLLHDNMDNTRRMYSTDYWCGKVL